MLHILYNKGKKISEIFAGWVREEKHYERLRKIRKIRKLSRKFKNE